MIEKMKRMWGIPALRNNILFVILMLVIFRITAHIPVPGIDTQALKTFLEGNQLLGLLNVFSGGTLKSFSLVTLGVAPYITASIIFQLLAMVVPSLEELQKEGESGQQKINMYTRISAVPLALLQAYGLIKLMSSSQAQVLTDLSSMTIAAIMLTATAGTMFLMWLGELITEKKVGNGVSLIIFAGIVSSLPQSLQTVLVNYDSSNLLTYIAFAAIVVITIFGVVVISEGQRNIPVSYAKQNGGYGRASANTHLPLRVNMAGVIPIIFAISVLLFPSIVAQFFVNGTGTGALIAQRVVSFFSNQLVHGVLYFFLVFGFTYFYTAVVFQPQKLAENLHRQGGFIPGIRPGKQTEEYVAKIMHRLVFIGAVFLATIAVLPLVLQYFTGTQSLAIGGTSVLIVVSVCIETAKQIQAQLTLHEYDHA
jgi:preprotein translocase subunit SecY